jgi:hypothetical protein
VGRDLYGIVWTDHDDPKELRGFNKYLLALSGGQSIFTNRKLSD